MFCQTSNSSSPPVPTTRPLAFCSLAFTQWVDRVPEIVPGYPDRLIPKPEHAAELKKRTLTNLYNQRPAWLVNAHRALDEAVAAAHGWPVDMSDYEILRRLLALNLERTP